MAVSCDRGELQALHVAAELDNVACVQLLLSHKAAIEGKDSQGCTPLLWTAQNDAARAAQALIQAGANVNALMRGQPVVHN